MSITPPSQIVWWNEPIHRIEVTWIILALIWCLVLFLWMPYWHVYGEQNLSNEAYRISAEDFQEKAQAMVDKYTVRKETEEEIPVVKPPPGSDVYLVAGGFRWWPILELEKDKSYRLHISSTDYQHGLSIQPVNINIQILPGYENVMTITPNEAMEYGIICNEFCGLAHHMMLGKIYVK